MDKIGRLCHKVHERKDIQNLQNMYEHLENSIGLRNKRYPKINWNLNFEDYLLLLLAKLTFSGTGRSNLICTIFL